MTWRTYICLIITIQLFLHGCSSIDASDMVGKDAVQTVENVMNYTEESSLSTMLMALNEGFPRKHMHKGIPSFDGAWCTNSKRVDEWVHRNLGALCKSEHQGIYRFDSYTKGKAWCYAGGDAQSIPIFMAEANKYSCGIKDRINVKVRSGEGVDRAKWNDYAINELSLKSAVQQDLADSRSKRAAEVAYENERIAGIPVINQGVGGKICREGNPGEKEYARIKKINSPISINIVVLGSYIDFGLTQYNFRLGERTVSPGDWHPCDFNYTP